jgi:hypothetical protein
MWRKGGITVARVPRYCCAMFATGSLNEGIATVLWGAGMVRGNDQIRLIEAF